MTFAAPLGSIPYRLPRCNLPTLPDHRPREAPVPAVSLEALGDMISDVSYSKPVINHLAMKLEMKESW